MPHVLIVDDSADVAAIIAAHLTNAGYTIEIARNGQEAIDKLMAGCMPDIILLDLCMPVLDGNAVLEWLQQQTDRRFSMIPIVLLTGYMSELRTNSPTLMGKLDKPFKGSELLDEIARVLESAEGHDSGEGG